MARRHAPDRFAGPLQRRLVQTGRMGVGDRLPGDGTQPEPLRHVVGRRLQPAVIEDQALADGVFEEQLAVVGAGQRTVDHGPGGRRVESGPLEE